MARDDGSDDAAILGANAVALPPGHRQDRRTGSTQRRIVALDFDEAERLYRPEFWQAPRPREILMPFDPERFLPAFRRWLA